MTLKTKADIGATIYYIKENKVASNIVVSITINIDEDAPIKIKYLLKEGNANYNWIEEERTALSLEELTEKLRSDYFTDNNIVEVGNVK